MPHPGRFVGRGGGGASRGAGVQVVVSGGTEVRPIEKGLTLAVIAQIVEIVEKLLRLPPSKSSTLSDGPVAMFARSSCAVSSRVLPCWHTSP